MPMSNKQSIAQKNRSDRMRNYIRKQLKFKPSFVLDEFPKWSIYHGDNFEADDGSWNYNAIENAIAYSEIKKHVGI
jgi:hypothetical protein